MTTPISVLLAIADERKLASDAFPRALSALAVKNGKPGAGPKKIPDGGGLALYIPPSGAKTWRYRFRFEGSEQTLSLGGYPEISLDDARKAHRAARWLVERGQSPSAYIKEALDQLRAEQQIAALGTFGAVAKQWCEATQNTLSPRTARHRAAMLDRWVLPELKDALIAEISRKNLVAMLARIDRVFPETAKHCRTYIKQIFEYALDLELVQGSPVPGSNVLVNHGSRRPVPRKALPLDRLGEFLGAVDASAADLGTKLALKLIVLTWTRTAELVGARWEEFDLNAGIWIIPAERMKSGVEHKIYLSTQAICLLRKHKSMIPTGFLFPNARDPERCMSRMTMSNWRKRMGWQQEMDIHGLRALGSTWANETGKYRPDVIEVALAHQERDRVRAAYNRAEFIRELRALWQDWGNLCESAQRGAST